MSASKRVSAMDLLVVDSEVRPEAVLVHAVGEIDSSTAEQLRTRLQSALQQAESQGSRLLILDLQGVTYFGSAGLNAVLDCHKQGVRTGTSVRLVADNGLVVRPIEVTNLDSLLDLYPTLPDALEGRNSEQGS
ncbi:MAG TPA: STAS domain-containing protein [Mycobacterium sp.]|nr:STAS domain-containing protein [Mycobacterium sp.]